MSDPPSQANATQNKTNQDFKKQKIGHRRVNAEGTVTYKKKTTSEIQKAIQLGVNISVGSINSKPKRDMLLKDFGVVELISIPKAGTRTTPAHQLSDFQFRTFAPIAFRFFRDMFKVDMCEFMDSICTKDLRELSNPGASGSIFYITLDDEFIIKTVDKKEAIFLQKLLPEYYINLMQHPRTLLPKFYGLYCYETMGKNIRFVIMNNLLPSIKIHEKYDLKGSTYKRYASKKERSKSSPTLKDLDFKENHPEGLILEPETYDALMQTISRDCMVLESFSIMDFSLLLGIHNIDQYKLEKYQESAAADLNRMSLVDPVMMESGSGEENVAAGDSNTSALNRTEPTRSSSHGRSIKRIAAYSTPLESIQRDAHTVLNEYNDIHDLPLGGIPARNNKGERLCLYLGVIDILQSYQINKKLEHGFKSLMHDGVSALYLHFWHPIASFLLLVLALSLALFTFLASNRVLPVLPAARSRSRSSTVHISRSAPYLLLIVPVSIENSNAALISNCSERLDSMCIDKLTEFVLSAPGKPVGRDYPSAYRMQPVRACLACGVVSYLQ